MNGSKYPYNNTAMSIGHAEYSINRCNSIKRSWRTRSRRLWYQWFVYQNFKGFNDFDGDRSFSKQFN